MLYVKKIAVKIYNYFLLIKLFMIDKLRSVLKNNPNFFVLDCDLDNMLSIKLFSKLFGIQSFCSNPNFFIIELYDILKNKELFQLLFSQEKGNLVLLDIPLDCFYTHFKKENFNNIILFDHHDFPLKKEWSFIGKLDTKAESTVSLLVKEFNIDLEEFLSEEELRIYDYVLKVEQEKFEEFDEKDELFYFLFPIYWNSGFFRRRFFVELNFKYFFDILNKKHSSIFLNKIKQKSKKLLNMYKVFENKRAVIYIFESYFPEIKYIPYIDNGKEILYFYPLTFPSYKFIFRTYNKELFNFYSKYGGGRYIKSQNKYIGGGEIKIDSINSFLKQISSYFY
jgi:hypothetical protein